MYVVIDEEAEKEEVNQTISKVEANEKGERKVE